jgi:hypothetical protein
MPVPSLSNPPLRSAPAEAVFPAAEGPAPGVLGKLRAIWSTEPFLNTTLVLAIVVGFFHGWLKIKVRHPATTFAFDFFILIALVVVLLRQRSLKAFFPPGRITTTLFIFYGMCLAYLPFSLVPGTPPPLVALASIRTWCFATLLFGLGYQLIRSREQMNGYLLLIVLLGVLTGVYGVFQSQDEVLLMMQEDADFRARYQGQGFVDSEGQFHLRRFSTFISSGAFGSVMATVGVFIFALCTDRRTRGTEKLLLIAALVPVGYGMLLSGARTSVIQFGLGVLLIAWLRPQVRLLTLLGLAVAGAFVLVGDPSGVGEAVADRIGTLAKLNDIIARLWIPTRMGLEFAVGHPLGGGLGKVGQVPFFLLGRTGYDDYYSPDGDVGRLLVEFGFLGLLAFGALLWYGTLTSWRVVKAGRSGLSDAVILAAAANLWISLVTIFSGSPFLGIPLGIMVWFFLGAAVRLAEQEGLMTLGRAGPAGMVAAPAAAAAPPASPRRPPGPAAPPVTRTRRFLYDTSGPPAPPPAGPPARPAPGRKRFLYDTPGSSSGQRTNGRPS